MQILPPDNLFRPDLAVLLGWAAKSFHAAFKRHPQVFVRAETGEEGELTLETERQMVRGGGWPCASALAKGQTEEQPIGVHAG